jgi:hypothetical protein
VVWLVTPEPTTQLVTGMAGAGALELKQLVRDYGSHSVNHNVESGNYYGGARGRGGRGGVNEGPTYYTGKTYWGVVKVCCADQDGSLPMYGSWKEDHYKAPPMDGSKEESTTGGWRCATMPTTAKQHGPRVVAAAKGPTMPAAVPVGLATATAQKGSPTRGWGAPQRQCLLEHQQLWRRPRLGRL